MTPAFDQVIGTGRPQHVGYMTWGFGDTVFYEDQFNYPDDTALKDALPDMESPEGETNVKYWADAAATIICERTDAALKGCGAVGLGTVTASSGEYKGFAGDEWNDFFLEVPVGWYFGTDATFTLWCSSVSGAGDHGAKLTLAIRNVWNDEAKMYDVTLTVTLDTKEGTPQSYAWKYGLSTQQGLTARVEAKGSTVTVRLDDGGDFLNRQVLSMTRGTDTPCSKAGFTITIEVPNTMPAHHSRDRMEAWLGAWELEAKTVNEDVIKHKLLAVCDGKVWAEKDDNSALNTTAEDTDSLADVPLISGAPLNGVYYFVDGIQPMAYYPMASTNKVRAWQARKGAIDKACTLACVWNGRMVLSGTKDDPQNIFMSRVDAPTDFDYGQDDAESAVALNEGEQTRINAPNVALYPISKDILFVGCADSCWILHGNPAAGGRVQKIVDVGIVGPYACTMDDNGMFYWMSPQGLIEYKPLGGWRNLTDKILPDVGGYSGVRCGQTAGDDDLFVTLAYDYARNVLYCYLTPQSNQGDAVHLVLDTRTGGFFEDTYNAAFTPSCAAWYPGDYSNQRLVLGGVGKLYEYDDAATNDVVEVGTEAPIYPVVVIGPIVPFGPGASAVQSVLQYTSSDANGSNEIIVNAYDNAAQLNASGFELGTSIRGPLAADGNGTRFLLRDRIRGNCFAYTVYIPVVESILVEYQYGGILR